MRKHTVLFDMDGTLTEPRQKFDGSLSSSLSKLSYHADIGIVTGSDFDYLLEQVGPLLDSPTRYCLRLLPCNGTRFCDAPEFPSDKFKIDREVNMKKEIGSIKYRFLIQTLIDLQKEATGYDIPLTGNFIATRGSMVNWCPIGRSANDKERKNFKQFDKKYNFRNQFFMKLRLLLDSNNMQDVIVKLGGDTSFDIYPAGWDKTYALRYFQGSTVWFVGDRAHSPKGNDYEIFKACEPRSFHTTGPEQTKEVIEDIIKRIVEEK